MNRSALFALVLSGFLVACASDPGADTDPSGSNTDAGTIDAGGQADVDDPTCRGAEIPEGGIACDCEGAQTSGVVGECQRACACTGGFWECDNECEGTDALQLSFDDGPEIAEVAGNGDPDVNPGETWRVEGLIVAENAPDGGATVTVQANTASSRLIFESNLEVIEGVEAEPEEFGIDFDIAETASAGEIVLTVEIFTDGFDIVSEDVAVEIVELELPDLAWSNPQLSEVTGNGNSFIEAGESWQAAVTLTNEGTAIAENVGVAVTPTSETLIVPSLEVEPITLAPGASTTVTIPFDVAAEPSELTPALQVVTTGESAPSVQTTVNIQVQPPDTLSLAETRLEQAPGGGNDNGTVDEGETWQVVFVVENTGSFDVDEINWSLINYVATSDEEPAYVDLGFALSGEPMSIAGGATAEVIATTTYTAETGDLGRLLLNVRSSVRRHGPFAFDVSWPEL